ncbi:uncharacterized protein LOC115306050 isoform X1 [Suricata suricatta]|uniref:uncharacterized protein LOC115306050 isoform X1 n=1 Tax=Suricata suricatta TaxID=37032 RepID=UPI001156A4CF|nr:uncharacterized protein LOC115306050 isoform X1 [Suricata suricatta]XP_029812084.1 uncharacterized protein LOC115306050 isoform X1 [Suricata suricatta]
MAGTGGTLGHLSAPSKVQPLALYLDPTAQVPALRQNRLCNATPSPKKPTLPQDVPSTLVNRSPERSTQDRGTDSDFPLGYLVHALQTTLWTFSLLFKSPLGEGGKKNPEEIRVNWKEKKVRKGVHSGEKAQTLSTFKRQQGFQEGVGRPLPTGTWPETRHPQPHCPSFRQKGFQLQTGRPPSGSWANTEVTNGHPTPASCSPFLSHSF